MNPIEQDLEEIRIALHTGQKSAKKAAAQAAFLRVEALLKRLVLERRPPVRDPGFPD